MHVEFAVYGRQTSSRDSPHSPHVRPVTHTLTMCPTGSLWQRGFHHSLHAVHTMILCENQIPFRSPAWRGKSKAMSSRGVVSVSRLHAPHVHVVALHETQCFTRGNAKCHRLLRFTPTEIIQMFPRPTCVRRIERLHISIASTN
jgi:hypothetical protein